MRAGELGKQPATLDKILKPLTAIGKYLPFAKWLDFGKIDLRNPPDQWQNNIY
jgi:hypothetical protein